MNCKTKLIYLADDDVTFLNALEKYLINLGFEIKSMEDGFDVLTLCQYIVPDVIISDIRMKKLDGISLLEALKNRDETKNIPVIFMSAYTDDEPMQMAKKLGARFFLFKPFSLECLEKEIDKTLKIATFDEWEQPDEWEKPDE